MHYPTKKVILKMTYKWNEAEAQTYAEAFSNLICEEFFRDKDQILGNQLLQITEIKQLNMLIIKNLYDKWQEETARLKSPFFDFEQEEVKEALTSFMNVLSKHISIKQASFKTLLSKSVFDTLQLTQSSKSYFENQLRNLPDFKLTPDWLEKNEKYFIYNKHIIKSLQNKLGNSTTFANQAIKWLEDIVSTEQADEASDILEELNNIYPLKTQEVYSAGKSFFDDALEKAMAAAPRRVNVNPVVQPEATPIAVKKEAIQQEVFQKQPEIVKPQPEVVKPEIVSASVPQRAEIPSSLRLNEKHLSISGTLNERITGESSNSLSDLHQKRRINNLKEGISLNQRYLFIKNLFGGDQDAFIQSLEALESFSSISEAKRHIDNSIANQFRWNKDAEETEEFYAHLERRFA